jgi:hypothetical protein
MVADTLVQLCAVLAELDDANSELTASATTRPGIEGAAMAQDVIHPRIKTEERSVP